MPRSLSSRLQEFAPRSDGQRRIQLFMLDHIEELSRLSLDDIAAATGTSQPTVTRFMRQLGYENALAMRTAAALHHQQRGRLSPEHTRQAASLICGTDDLLIYAPPAMDRFVDDIFRSAYPRIDRSRPMKPHIQERRSRRIRTADNFNREDALLVLAIDDLPAGYDFEALFRYARDKGTAVLVLQAMPFEIADPTGIHVFSLGLSTSDHEAIAAIHLAACVADIRALAATLT